MRSYLDSLAPTQNICRATRQYAPGCKYTMHPRKHPHTHMHIHAHTLAWYLLMVVPLVVAVIQGAVGHVLSAHCPHQPLEDAVSVPSDHHVLAVAAGVGVGGRDAGHRAPLRVGLSACAERVYVCECVHA